MPDLSDNNPNSITFSNLKKEIPTSSELVKSIINLTGKKRDDFIFDWIQSGFFPSFMNNFIDVEIKDGSNSLVYSVSPDFVCIGNDIDFLRVPMMPGTAQKIADMFDCSLPTEKMVNDIWKSSEIKLEPSPNGPPYDHTMENTDKFVFHNQKIQNQLPSNSLNKLISGHKKDIIITNSLISHPNNVAIYGWIKSNGKPIQPLNAISHDKFYCDYSHGVRLIKNKAFLNKNEINLSDLFKDTNLSKLISYENPLLFTKYSLI